MVGAWPPSELDAMPVAEIQRWHGIAIDRHRREQEAMKHSGK